MFHAGGSVCTLYAFCKWHCHLSGKIRILAHIFKISSTKGTSLNIYTWCQNHVFSASTASSQEQFRPHRRDHGSRLLPTHCCLADRKHNRLYFRLPSTVHSRNRFVHPWIIRHYKLRIPRRSHRHYEKADPWIMLIFSSRVSRDTNSSITISRLLSIIFTSHLINPERVRACLKKAFCKMCVTICGRFCRMRRRSGLRQPNSGKIYRKVGRADC